MDLPWTMDYLKRIAALLLEIPRLLPQWVAGCEYIRTFRAPLAILHYNFKDRPTQGIILPPNRKLWRVPENQL
jgi:hypothetical protein